MKAFVHITAAKQGPGIELNNKKSICVHRSLFLRNVEKGHCNFCSILSVISVEKKKVI